MPGGVGDTVEVDHDQDLEVILEEGTVMDDHQCLRENDMLVTGSILLQANVSAYLV